jgi:hypothetical protein
VAAWFLGGHWKFAVSSQPRSQKLQKCFLFMVASNTIFANVTIFPKAPNLMQMKFLPLLSFNDRLLVESKTNRSGEIGAYRDSIRNKLDIFVKPL